MDVRKTIAELTSQISEIHYESEDDNVVLKDCQTDELYNSGLHENNGVEIGPSKLRKIADSLTLPGNIYSGRTTSRKQTFSSSDLSDNENPSSHDESNEETEEESEKSSDEAESSETDASTTVFSKTNKAEKVGKETIECNIYSAKSKNISSDIKKGTSIRNQMRIWESLLECRIKLQKGLVACNNLPAAEHMLNATTKMNADDRIGIKKCQKSLILLLRKMVGFQEDLIKRFQEFGNTSNLLPDASNEEIPSDESEIEDNDVNEDEESGLPKRKKMKLSDFSSAISNAHNKFIPIRNASIQKWNDKTKVSSGKMANTNFSAFDLSTLKQVEQILADKNRLINRTRIKRNENQSNSSNTQETNQEVSIDPEIFDDTDFYHKLLRDYIEKKSMDSSNSSHTERQIIELQKLRSKMKRKVDTKSTKGRKLRYVAMPKLVNFMAPQPYNTWSEQAENELYSSLFGKIKLL